MTKKLSILLNMLKIGIDKKRDLSYIRELCLMVANEIAKELDK